MKSLGRFSVRHRWLVLIIWIVAIVGLNAAAQSVGSAYSNDFNLPGTNSTNAYHLLLKAFPSQAGETDNIVFHSLNGTPVASQENAINANLAQLAALPGVSNIQSPFCTGPFANETVNGFCLGSAHVSHDQTIAYAQISFRQPGYKIPLPLLRSIEKIGSQLNSSSLEVRFGGNAFGQLDAPVGSKGEIFGLLAAAIVLFLAFGSLLAMLLPLAVAMFATFGVASAVTVLLSHGMGIAQFAPILGDLIGLGVGIDYSLFIVTRVRQELKKGASVEDAVVTAINTSGRAVMFAGLTVCVALLGMFVLRLSYLNGVAVSATLTVLVTVIAAVTLMPALIGFMKHRVLSRRERRRMSAGEDIHHETFWARWSGFVSRHPGRLSAVALVVVVALALPFVKLHLGSSDQGSNPPTTTTRQAYDLLSQGFGAGYNGPLQVVAKITSPADKMTLTNLEASLPHVRGVASVSPVIYSPTGNIGLINVVPTTSPQSTATDDLIVRLRNAVIPAATSSTHTTVYVGGITAIFYDFANVLGSKLPLFLTVIILLGCLLLMVAFRSVLIPLTAAVMNVLATGASFGLVVAVFEWGWGSHLLNAGTGPVEAFLPNIMIAILFGLSMDYQVFLVSRMHEEWVTTGDNELAITRGQANTGRVITAAALIMISVFFSFAFGGQRVIAEFGVGLGGAVLIDAFVIRTVLVPALMHRFGKANWWMPKWLDRVIPNLAIEAGD